MPNLTRRTPPPRLDSLKLAAALLAPGVKRPRMDPGDYKRFLNFLSTHDCTVDFREFRAGHPKKEREIQPLLKVSGVATSDDEATAKRKTA